MRYPDGTTIGVGDLVWWDGGHCLGYVQVIADSQDEFERWGLQSPHIFIDNTHPFHPSARCGVAYAESVLEEDGIALVSSDELIEIRRATTTATNSVAPEFRQCPYSVVAEIDSGRQVGWVFNFWKADSVVQTLRVPANPKATS